MAFDSGQWNTRAEAWVSPNMIGICRGGQLILNLFVKWIKEIYSSPRLFWRGSFGKGPCVPSSGKSGKGRISIVEPHIQLWVTTNETGMFVLTKTATNLAYTIKHQSYRLLSQAADRYPRSVSDSSSTRYQDTAPNSPSPFFGNCMPPQLFGRHDPLGDELHTKVRSSWSTNMQSNPCLRMSRDI
jgi:hypothetical protein